MKQTYPIVLIFLMLIHSSCYSIYPLKIEHIEAGQQIVITTRDDEQQEIEAITFKEDSLFGIVTDNVFNQETRLFEMTTKSISIPAASIKSLEKKEYNPAKTLLLTLTIIVLTGYIIASTVTIDFDPFPGKR